jgi:hypothetical protein
MKVEEITAIEMFIFNLRKEFNRLFYCYIQMPKVEALKRFDSAILSAMIKTIKEAPDEAV